MKRDQMYAGVGGGVGQYVYVYISISIEHNMMAQLTYVLSKLAEARINRQQSDWSQNTKLRLTLNSYFFQQFWAQEQGCVI